MVFGAVLAMVGLAYVAVSRSMNESLILYNKVATKDDIQKMEEKMEKNLEQKLGGLTKNLGDLQQEMRKNLGDLQQEMRTLLNDHSRRFMYVNFK